jgi:hypothetical protein
MVRKKAEETKIVMEKEVQPSVLITFLEIISITVPKFNNIELSFDFIIITSLFLTRIATSQIGGSVYSDSTWLSFPQFKWVHAGTIDTVGTDLGLDSNKDTLSLLLLS